MPAQKLSVTHPGIILLEQFIVAHGISVWHLARDIGVTTRRIYEIVQGQRSINADIARRLAHYFGMSERYWLELQRRYDVALQNERFQRRVNYHVANRLASEKRQSFINRHPAC
jgi:addiction module HigA family antidote